MSEAIKGQMNRKLADRHKNINEDTRSHLIEKWVVPVHPSRILLKYSNHLEMIMLNNEHHMTFQQQIEADTQNSK